MKKFLAICILLFIVNISCKKMDLGGGGLCACSPIAGPELFLMIRNTAGEDLLDPKTIGAYSKGEIQLFRKDENGKEIPVNFSIRPSFIFGEQKAQFNFNQLYVQEFNFSQNQTTKSLYLKLGKKVLYELDIQFRKSSIEIETLLINKIDAERDKRIAPAAPFFYLTQSSPSD